MAERSKLLISAGGSGLLACGAAGDCAITAPDPNTPAARINIGAKRKQFIEMSSWKHGQPARSIGTLYACGQRPGRNFRTAKLDRAVLQIGRASCRERV